MLLVDTLMSRSKVPLLSNMIIGKPTLLNGRTATYDTALEPGRVAKGLVLSSLYQPRIRCMAQNVLLAMSHFVSSYPIVASYSSVLITG